MKLKLKNYIFKKLSSHKKFMGGRNRLGIITVNHRGSKCTVKQRYVNLDFKFAFTNLNYVLLDIRHCSGRSGFIGSILLKNGLFAYILVSKGVLIGDVWSFEYFRNLKLGDYLKLSLIPEGFSIFNVELILGQGGQVARSAGTSVKIINRYPNLYNKILVKFRSGEEYFINGNCGASIGVTSNSDHWLLELKTAGARRKKGRRSIVRGVAMNPVDHPHGGNTPGGKPCMSPSGLLTKGRKTRSNIICKKKIFKRSKSIFLKGKKNFKGKNFLKGPDDSWLNTEKTTNLNTLLI